MSRGPFRSKRPQNKGIKPGIGGDPTDEAIINQAGAFFGGEAALAVAYCGLDAWLEDDEVEFHRFARVFKRLRN